MIIAEEITPAFKEAFDVIVQSVYVARVDDLRGLYSIEIKCRFITRPAEEIWKFFDMQDCGHPLSNIETRHDQYISMMTLMYRTYTVEKFLNDVKNAKYRRFSETFHEQLEDTIGD